MLKKIKMFKKIERSGVMKEAKQLDYNKDGSVQINVGLKNVEDFFLPYSFKTYELTNPDIIDYINMCEESIPKNERISLDIYLENKASKEAKQRIRHSIKRYYAEKIVRLKKEKHRNLLFGISYIVLGILLLLLESFFYDFFQKIHIEFLLDVVGWLFLWDGVETIIGEWDTIRQQLNQSYHLLNARIHIRQYGRRIQKKYKIGDFEEVEDSLKDKIE